MEITFFTFQRNVSHTTPHATQHAATRRGGQQQSQQKGFMINSHDLVFMVQRWELRDWTLDLTATQHTDVRPKLHRNPNLSHYIFPKSEEH